jgi:pimeloyl-ACP methyl ester carboxylesterase
MNKMMSWDHGMMLSVLLLGGLASGCGAVTGDGGTVTRRYETQFRHDHPYVDRVVMRDGLRIAARQFAATGPVSGAPVVLLHGYPDSQHLYDAVVPLLQREREVVTFDFVGWGSSDKPSPSVHRYDAASLRADLEAVLASFAYEQVTLVVHDASGWPGIDWALDHPERVASLVVLNTVYHPSMTSRPPEGLAQYALPSPKRDALIPRVLEDDRLWVEGSAEEGIIGFGTQIGKFFENDAARAALLPVFIEESLAMRPAFIALASQLVPEITAHAAAIPRMAAYTRPVVIAFGVDDPYLNQGVAADFAARFPGSRRIDIAGGNHYVQLDQPERVAAAILTTF